MIKKNRQEKSSSSANMEEDLMTLNERFTLCRLSCAFSRPHSVGSSRLLFV